jgi:hypothetical protein
MPPVAKKQLPNGPLPRKPKALISDVWGDIDTMSMLLYGESGTGKTTLWSTFPGRTKVFVCSGGNKPGELRSVSRKDRERIDPVVINSTDELAEELDKGEDYDNWVMDHVSGFLSLIIKEDQGMDDIPQTKTWRMVKDQRDWQKINDRCISFVRKILNLSGNRIVVGQETIFKGKDDGVDSEIIKPVVGAAVTPGVAKWINPAFDYVVQTFKKAKTEKFTRNIAGKEVVEERRGKGIEYCLRVGPHDYFMTKFRMEKDRNLLLPEYIVDPTYDKIRELIDG